MSFVYEIELDNIEVGSKYDLMDNYIDGYKTDLIRDLKDKTMNLR